MNDLSGVINAIRINGIEAITNAQSGHPGIVLGAAPTLVTLFANHLNYCANDPYYFNRDRFILSAGHGSALLYAIITACQLQGTNIADLSSFRQLNSSYAGHPERNILPGIEVTTGPLGQGVANAVGMAIAEARLNHLYQINNQGVVDHYTYCLFGDGCFQEGIFHEAISIASHYQLQKLILIYDANDVQLDGPTSNSESLDPQKYFAAMNFDCHLVVDGENFTAIDQAITKAKKSAQPSVIIVKSIIGAHSSKAGLAAAHGAPLSVSEIQNLRAKFNYKTPAFSYPQQVYQAFQQFHKRSQLHRQAFENRLATLLRDNPKKGNQLQSLINQKFSCQWNQQIPHLSIPSQLASRELVGEVYQLVTQNNPTITTLNCDLSSSTKIAHYRQPLANRHNYAAANWNLGVREFAMMAINNGMTAHGGVLGVGSTFLVFADYFKAALRLSALSHLPTMTVLSHDSIMVGEDGPTHQPIEQLWMLRAIPNLLVTRPCNVSEITVAFELWLNNNPSSPVVIVSSRQKFTIHKSSCQQARKGGYVIYGPKKGPTDLTILATGSEVPLAIAAAKIIAQQKITIKVVSLWCLQLFQKQSKKYTKQVLGTGIKVSLELGSTIGWKAFADDCLGIDHFGLSANANDLVQKWKMTPKGVAKKLMTIWQKHQK